MAEVQKHAFRNPVVVSIIRSAEMRRLSLPLKFAMSACALFLCCFPLVQGLGAQASQPQQQAKDPTIPQQPVAPLPANGSVESGQQSNIVPTQNGLTQTQPDTHALSGVEELTTGSLLRLTDMFDPGLSFSDLGYSAPGQAGSTTLTSGATVVGTLAAAKAWAGSNLEFGYGGSDTYYYPTAFLGPRNLPSHNAGLSLTIVDKRWTFRLRDSFLYSWQAGFGNLFTGGPASEGQLNQLAAVQPSLNPLGTVLTGFARQVNDLSSAEVDYSVSRRTTLTLSGSYQLLDFLTSGYLSSHTVSGRAGYNYALNSKNTFALLSEYDSTSYSGTTSRFDSSLIEMSFGRKITGRLAFQVAAGPELTSFHNFGASNAQQLSWSVSSSLTRETPRTDYFVSYLRAVTPGSGVNFGSHTNTVTGSVSRRFAESWSGSINGGYAANTALVPSIIFASTFKNWFAGANLGKQVGRHLSLGLSYQYQRQIVGSGACPVLSCGVVPAYQVFGVTMHWHPWSKVLQ
jgi:hypothetical protein